MKTLRRKSACIILRHRDGEGTQDVQEKQGAAQPHFCANGYERF
jgi:hypothetical protein